MASLSEARHSVEANGRGVAFIDLGPGAKLTDRMREIEELASQEPNFIKGIWHMMEGVNAFWTPLYDGLLRVLRADRPDVMIVDFATPAGVDAASSLNIPMIVNNADLLSALSLKILPYSRGAPRLFCEKSVFDIDWTERIKSSFLTFIGPTALSLTLGRRLNAIRRTRGLRPVDHNLWLKDKLILVNSAFGLEYNRPIPPLVQMTGPMLPATVEPLSEEYVRWLDQGPVVYANLGTLARAPREQISRMAEGFRSDRYRVLWVMRKAQQALLPANLAGNIRVVDWGPPPVSVLSHEKVSVFVSHCGINSIHESLHAGTPIVGIPMFADQRDMALRVQDAGVGLFLNKTRFTSEELKNTIARVMSDESFRKNIPAIQSSFRLAGGVKRAADLIEEFTAVGADHYRERLSGSGQNR